MATVRGALGQAAPVAAVLTDMYVVPAAKSATGRIIITNRGLGVGAFRVALAVAGAPDSPEQYVAFDKAIAGNDTGSTIAFMLNEGDVVRVYSGNDDLSFTFTGIEQDN